MKIIEFYGGPGSGKTTLATSAWGYFKRNGIDCEFTREHAQELIYEGREHLLQYQFVVAAGQYRKYKELELAGTKVVFSDTGLLMSKVYGDPGPLNDKLMEFLELANQQFDIIKVFIKRVKPFSPQGRVHNEAQSRELDFKMFEAFQPFDIIVTGDDSGLEQLITALSGVIGKGE